MTLSDGSGYRLTQIDQGDFPRTFFTQLSRELSPGCRPNKEMIGFSKMNLIIAPFPALDLISTNGKTRIETMPLSCHPRPSDIPEVHESHSQ